MRSLDSQILRGQYLGDQAKASARKASSSLICRVIRPAAGGRRGRTADVAGALGLDVQALQGQLQPGVDEGPAAHVLRLFLAPDEVGVLEALQHIGERLQRPGIELLET